MKKSYICSMNFLWFPFPGQFWKANFHVSTGTKPRVKAAYKQQLVRFKHPFAVSCNSVFIQHKQNVPGQHEIIVFFPSWHSQEQSVLGMDQADNSAIAHRLSSIDHWGCVMIHGHQLGLCKAQGLCSSSCPKCTTLCSQCCLGHWITVQCPAGSCYPWETRLLFALYQNGMMLL